MSDDDNSCDNTSERSSSKVFNVPKRLKTHNRRLEKEDSSTCLTNTEQESPSASTSTDSGLPSDNTRNNKRKRLLYTPPVSNNSSGSTHELFTESMDSSSGVEEEDCPLREDSSDRHSEDNVSRISSPEQASDCTVINDTDTESDEEVPEVLKKEKPKPNWFMVPAVVNRQIGSSSKVLPQIFSMKCYASLRNVQRLELMYKLEEHEGCVNSLNFHPNGNLLASGSDDLKVVVWDWRINKCLIKYDTKHRSNVVQSKFLNLSGDLHIATSGRDGQVRIAQVSSEEGLRDNRKLGSHRGACHKLAVLNDQPHLVLSAGEDGIVLRHDVRRNKPDKIVVVKEDDREVALYSIHAHPLNSNEFCVSGRDSIVRIYDQRKSNKPVSIFYPFEKPNNNLLHVTCAVYNYVGTEILASYNDESIYLFDVQNSKPGTYSHQYSGHRNGATIKGVNFFGPKSEFIVSGSDCGNVYFWERNTEAIVQFMLADDNGVVNCLEPHPQLPFICTSGMDWDIKVWVPSCEYEPDMKNLAETIRDNYKSRDNWSSDPSGINESQMLWMLWRHLRSTNRIRLGMRRNLRDPDALDDVGNESSTSDSSSNVNSSSEDDDDSIDGPMGCSTS